MSDIEKIKKAISVHKDFPSKGIMFRDISPLMRDNELREKTFDLMAKKYIDQGIHIDVVAGIESRGFIFGTALATRLKASFVMIRKPGKLPGETVCVDYGLEYGNNTLYLQMDALKPGQTVLIVDDLLATGGTAAAAVTLCNKVGGKVIGVCFAIELDGLNGKNKFADVDVFSLLHFPVGGEDVLTDKSKEEQKLDVQG
eukprot:TRINITY_DN2182_c0_g1_i1.p1 TRINITY_DN2182_c0_g1~~TRINITY_DN2182_c0_g1_i1.p1  ORF type:complete len:199 (-),score=60.02 TRINITY_DN2182_c0_g1_i1:79-675(-)